MAKYDHNLGDVIAGKYRITGTLGQGGMGSVYEAVNDAIGKRVAVKVLNAQLAEHPEFSKRFELEARASSIIDHPGIVDVLDMGRAEDGSPYIVMEYLQGVTVRQLQKKLGQMTPGQASALVIPVLDALDAAHKAGVIHRDLKPANLFLCVRPRPEVKILDFGISKFASGGGVTHTGSTLGTPAFMAPEQLKDGRNVGPHSDLYAVGAILYSLLVGRPPYEADSDFQLVAKVLTSEHPPVRRERPDIPPALGQLVDSLLAKDSGSRPDSAAEVKQRLLAVAPPEAKTVFAAAVELSPRTRTTSLPETPARATPLGSKGASATPVAPARTEQPTRSHRSPAPVPARELAPEEKTPVDVEKKKKTPVAIYAAVIGGLFVVSAGATAVLLRSSEPKAKPVEPLVVQAVVVQPPQPAAVVDAGAAPAVAVVEPPPPAAAVDAGVAAAPAPELVDKGPSLKGTPGKPDKGGKRGKNMKVIVVGDASAGGQSAVDLPGAESPASGSADTSNAAEVAAKEMTKARDLFAQRRTREAVAMLEENIARAERGNDRRAEAWAQRNRGNLGEDMNDCSTAAASFLKSVKLFEQVGDNAGIGLVANDLGMLGNKCGDIDRITWFKLSVEKRWKVRDLTGVRKSANNLGTAYLNGNEFENADHAFNEALIAATELRDYKGMVKIRGNLALVWVIAAVGADYYGDSLPPGLDKNSPAWKKAKAHYAQAVSVAPKAGMNEDQVCDVFGRLRRMCVALGE